MGVWDHAHWMRNEKIKNLKKKKFAEGSPLTYFSGSEEQRDSCRISSYSNLKSKGDDVIPIDSHVTSEEEKRKLYLTYFHILNFNFKKNYLQIQKKILSATFQNFEKNSKVGTRVCMNTFMSKKCN